MRVTFVLPGMNRSGGIRVTLDMASRLSARGYSTRIACRRLGIWAKYNPRSLARRGRDLAYRVRDLAIRDSKHNDWHHVFQGEILTFQDLNQIRFEKGEVVIALGSGTVKAVMDLTQDVIKVGYCHGFTYEGGEMWPRSMTTISVSKTLVPRLENLYGIKVAAVIPNGIETDLYYDERISRDGICMIHHSHPLKDPKTILELISRFLKESPQTPLYVFGEPHRPRVLPRQCYWRLPDVSTVRQLFNRSKIFVLPSRGEGFGLPILEAMACGCAVVSTANSGALEIIRDSVNGLITPIGDRSALFKSAQDLLQDDILRGKLVQEAYTTVSEFTWDNAVGKMEIFLETLT